MRSIKTRRGMEPSTFLSLLKAQPHTGTEIPPVLQGLIDRSINPAIAIKGDIVSFQHDEETRTGRVLKGGETAKVRLNDEFDIALKAHNLSKAELPIPDEALREWTVTAYSEKGLGRDGYMLTAMIARNGVNVMTCEDYADGGPRQFFPLGKGTAVDVSDFEEAITNYIESHNANIFEPSSSWVDYAWAIQPTGQSFIDYENQQSLS